MNNSQRIALAFACTLLFNCGGAPVKQQAVNTLSTEQIGQITSYPELLALQARLKTALQGKPQAAYADDYAALAQVEAQLITAKKAELSSQLATKRLDSGFVPLSVLDNLDREVAANPPLDADKWAQVSTQLLSERAKVEAKIAETELSLEQAGLAVDEKVAIYDQLHKLTGSEQWLQKRNAEVDLLVADIRQASASETYDESLQSKIEAVRGVAGDNAALVDELVTVDAKIYAKRYFDALAEGLADKAYEVLTALSKTNDFAAIKEKLSPSSTKMAEYFTALADESVEKPENLSQSYRWYSQAGEVRKILGLAPTGAASTRALVAQLHAKYTQLKKAGDNSAALAYLYAVQQFDPAYPSLRKDLTDQETLVRELALQRLSTTDFQSKYADQDYGDVITSLITQYLFEHIPNDVRIAERQQYDAIMRERGLNSESAALASVNLLISGSVTESKVDDTKAKNKKIMRVAVGKESIPNPAYVEWLKLPSKERKKVEQPSETIDVDKYENISIETTRHRKVGIFSVSYRLVEAASGRVIFPDSISVDNQVEDDSSQGVEMGEFVVPAKLANLPSDIEILDGLAKKISTEIGKKLVSVLEHQEQKYLEKAERAADQNDCVGETDNLAKSLMILNLKALPAAEVLEKLRRRATACY